MCDKLTKPYLITVDVALSSLFYTFFDIIFRYNPMSKKNIHILSTIILLSALSCLFVTTMSYGAKAPDSFGFMDLESSIKALRKKVEKVRISTVLIASYDKSGGVSRVGSGFFIDNEGRLITNALIMKDAYSAKIFTESNVYDNVTVLSRNEGADLALLKINAKNEAPIELDYNSKLAPGDRVYVVGKSSQLTTTVSEGLISNISIIGKIYDYIEIETTSGLLSYRYSKNGPVMSMQGKVIGVSTTLMPDSAEEDVLQRVYDGEKLNAVSVLAVKKLVEGPYSIERLNTAGTKIWPHWFLRKFKEYAVSSFVTLYTLGFPIIMSIVFVLIVIVSLIHWLFGKLRGKTN